jgi:DNA segregation ATPase FtsK/SpoIIIE-like protein
MEQKSCWAAPNVSEKETAAVVEFWNQQAQAEYGEGFLESPKDERAQLVGSNPDPDENDTMFDDGAFDDAVRLVFQFGKVSTPRTVSRRFPRQLFWICRRKKTLNFPVAFQKEPCHHSCWKPKGGLSMKEKR